MALRIVSSEVSSTDAMYPIMPPAKLSPAPVGSVTCVSGYAGALKKDDSVTLIAPCSPS